MSENTPVITGLIVGVIFVLGFGIAGYSAICGGSGAQYVGVNNEFLVANSDIIAYGTVTNVEMARVPVQYSQEEEISKEIRIVDTIITDKYLHDATERHAAFLTFTDTGFGCVSAFKSTVEGHSCRAQYNVGERSLYFISPLYDGWYSSGFSMKFDLSQDEAENEMLQSISYESRGNEPTPIPVFESEIQELIAMKSNGIK